MDDWQRRLPDLVDTMDAALDAADWDAVAALLDDYFYALSLSVPAVVDRVWDRVPQSWFVEHPRYLMASAITTAARRPFDIIDAPVDRIFSTWVQQQDPPATRDVLGANLAVVRRHLASGRFERAAGEIDTIQDILRDATDHDGLDDVLPSVLKRVGLVRLLSGSVGQAIGAFSEAWRWSMSTYPHPFAPFVAGYCALAHALAGDYVHARIWRDRSSIASEPAPGTMAFRLQGAAILTDVLLAIGAADQQQAEHAARAVERRTEFGELWWVAVHARARIALYWGDRADAAREIDASLHAYPSLTGPTSFAGIVLRSDLADLHQADGDLPAAQHVLDELTGDRMHPAVVSTVARQHILLGDADSARALLDAASRPPVLSGRQPARWEVLRANAAPADARTAAILTAKRRIEQTGAYDAAFDAADEIQAAIGLHVRSRPAGETGASRPPVRLTPRERQILDLLDQAPSVRELADALFISPNTAKSHLGRLYRKLGVENRNQAIRARNTGFTGNGPRTG